MQALIFSNSGESDISSKIVDNQWAGRLLCQKVTSRYRGSFLVFLSEMLINAMFRKNPRRYVPWMQHRLLRAFYFG